MKRIKILIADDHQLVLDGIKANIRRISEFEIVGEARDGREVLESADHLSVDVVLMDIDMPVMNGIEATAQLLRNHPHIKVLALTMHNEKGMIDSMLNAGASGYLLKNVDKEEMMDAIKKVAAGQKYFSSDVTLMLLQKKATEIISDNKNDIILTAREKEILQLVALGLSSKEIAGKLFISLATVESHRTNLFKKLKVKNAAELISLSMKNGYLS